VPAVAGDAIEMPRTAIWIAPPAFDEPSTSQSDGSTAVHEPPPGTPVA
jgi:hypothetical protein